ncbi:DUF5953 family protein [Myxococcus stipitatus]
MHPCVGPAGDVGIPAHLDAPERACERFPDIGGRGAAD